jgi:Serine hydroxymethyltransferase
VNCVRKRSKAYPLNHRLNRRPPETAGGFLYSHVIRRFAGLSGPNAPEKINTATVAYLANLTETAKVSPALARSIVQELADQRANLKLIASENYCSLSTQLTMGNLLTDKYAEGYPHSRFYAGCDNVDTIEDYACELPSPGEPDLLTVAKKVPHAVFCLLTALAFHRLTTQVPHAVEVALPRTARVPRLDHPPIKVFRFSSESLNVGIETHTLDGASIRFTAVKRLSPMPSSIETRSVSMSHLKPSGLTDLTRNGTFKRC